VNITVQDTTPPTIVNVPGPITREATSPSGASASWPAVTATDIVDVTVAVTCAPASGSTFAINAPGPVTTVTCTAVDSHGNVATPRTFTVTVVDTTPPTILNMPANMTVSPTGPTGANVIWTAPNATDIVDVTVPVICVPASGSFFPLGLTTVTCTATDAHGNPASASFTVLVADTTPPVVTVTLNPGILWPPNHKMVNIQVTVTTSDTDPNPVCRITTVTSSEPVDDNGDGRTLFDWLFSGLSLQLRAERSGLGPRGAIGRIYTVTVSCTDREGNTGIGTATAVVPHDMRKTTTTK
jgi:HYR domain